MERVKILVVDDEPDIVELVSYNLKKDGFIILSFLLPENSNIIHSFNLWIIFLAEINRKAI